MQFHEAELAILFTLAYTDQFEYPLTEAEVWQRLVSVNGKATSRADFKKALLRLALKKIVVYSGEYLCLAGRTALVQQRLSRQKIATEKAQEIKKFTQVVQFVPGIKAVFITGSVAMDNAESADDLDLLIVTQVNRLWLCRLEVLLISWILGKKKSRADEGKHGWCLNLWLDENHLAVESAKRDLYQAYEVVQAKPVLGLPEIIAQFYQANFWVKKYLPNEAALWVGKTQSARQKSEAREAHLESKSPSEPPQITLANSTDRFFNYLEHIAFVAQLHYMKAHRTTEKVGPGFAFFHPRPTDKLVKAGWLTAMQRLKKWPELATIADTYAQHLFANSPAKTP